MGVEGSISSHLTVISTPPVYLETKFTSLIRLMATSIRLIPIARSQATMRPMASEAEPSSRRLK